MRLYMLIADPDQTPHYVMSVLGLHYLRMSLYGTLDINGIMLKKSFDISHRKK